MPIYEYECLDCGCQFEVLHLPSRGVEPKCPQCEGSNLQRLVSGFGVASDELSRARVKAARKQLLQSKDHKDKQVAETEEVQEHLREHSPKR